MYITIAYIEISFGLFNRDSLLIAPNNLLNTAHKVLFSCVMGIDLGTVIDQSVIFQSLRALQ